MFGVPESARAAALRGAGVNVTTSITGEEAAANVEQWHDELYELAEIKRQTPGEESRGERDDRQEQSHVLIVGAPRPEV
jgi:hypothetical protein